MDRDKGKLVSVFNDLAGYVMPDHRPYRKWYMHRRDAFRRGIEFKLTFEEWMQIWLDSGHWHERGRGRGQYVMARPADQGAYEVGNVKIVLQAENTVEAHKGRKASAQTRAKMSFSRSGKPRTEETKRKIRLSNKKTWQSPILKAGTSALHKGRKHTDKCRERMSLGQRKRRQRERLLQA